MHFVDAAIVGSESLQTLCASVPVQSSGIRTRVAWSVHGTVLWDSVHGRTLIIFGPNKLIIIILIRVSITDGNT